MEYISKEWLLKQVREIGAYKAVLWLDIMNAPKSAKLDTEAQKAEVIEAAAKTKKKK